MGKKTISRVGTYLLVIVAVASLSFSAGMPVFSINAEKSIENFQGEPIITPLAELIEEQPRVWVDDGDFVISYDDDNDACPGFDSFPSIAVSPPGPSNPFGNSLHAVWHELGEDENYTIHYSMSWPHEKGLAWSNDEASEGDRTINDVSVGWNATNPSMAIDDEGTIHLVWCQEMDGQIGKGPVIPAWEVLYTWSTDNGQTWPNPNMLVSDFRMGGDDTDMYFFPEIAVTNDYVGLKVLHVVWSEYDPLLGQQEVFYKRSEGGGLWLNREGAFVVDVPISDTLSTDYAGNPDIAVGESGDQYVHVVWSQQGILVGGTSEIFYTRSIGAGSTDQWSTENIISNEPGAPDNLGAGVPKIAAAGDNVYSIWDQPLAMGGPSEICISSSDNAGATGWSGDGADANISFGDGNTVDWGSLDVVASPNGAAYATWTEWDGGSCEIHYSMSQTPDDPISWSGCQEDIVLSHPDGQDASNPSMSVADFGNGWDAQIIWVEVDTEVLSKAEHNPEIHYIPETTYNVSIASTGWNFISCPLELNDTTVLNALNDSWGDGNTTWDCVYWYDPGDSADHWKTHNQNWAGTQDLTTIDHTIGFWINITNLGDGNLTFGGDYPNSTDISLVIGWNLVGYPSNTTRQAQNTLPGWGTTVTKIAYYNSSAAYDITETSDGTTMMSAGNAYWVYSTAADKWTVNW